MIPTHSESSTESTKSLSVTLCSAALPELILNHPVSLVYVKPPIWSYCRKYCRYMGIQPQLIIRKVWHCTLFVNAPYLIGRHQCNSGYRGPLLNALLERRRQNDTDTIEADGMIGIQRPNWNPFNPRSGLGYYITQGYIPHNPLRHHAIMVNWSDPSEIVKDAGTYLSWALELTHNFTI